MRRDFSRLPAFLATVLGAGAFGIILLQSEPTHVFGGIFFASAVLALFIGGCWYLGVLIQTLARYGEHGHIGGPSHTAAMDPEVYFPEITGVSRLDPMQHPCVGQLDRPPEDRVCVICNQPRHSHRQEYLGVDDPGGRLIIWVT